MSDTIYKSCQEQMGKSIEHYEKELRGIRTGRASTALIEFLKVECYGSMCDLRDIAAVSVPEPTQLLVKPFDPTTKNSIAKSLETADLGLNPQVEGDSIRIHLPPPSAQRRQQLSSQVKKLAEDTKVSVRNERRDAIKQIDTLIKDKSNSFSEDDGKISKSNIDDLTKNITSQIENLCSKKTEEVESL
ncbi:MAG: ribosome recycling factor [Phycisphaerales bacterium]|nr:ribosome recycling factor [Phycisphaerales bacterium]